MVCGKIIPRYTTRRELFSPNRPLQGYTMCTAFFPSYNFAILPQSQANIVFYCFIYVLAAAVCSTDIGS